MKEKITKADQSDRTRTALLTSARELFGKQGYANTSTEEIVRETGVTRGAMYYHFRSKADLFQAVFIEVEGLMQRTIVQRVIEAEGDTWQRMVLGSRAFFKLCTKPDIQRILYVDGPAVLNKDAWQTLGIEGGRNIIRQNLRILMDHGYIEKQPLEALTHLWSGVYSESALYIARAEDKEAALAEAERCVAQLANGLRLQAQVARSRKRLLREPDDSPRAALALPAYGGLCV